MKSFIFVIYIPVGGISAIVYLITRTQFSDRFNFAILASLYRNMGMERSECPDFPTPNIICIDGHWASW